MACAVLALFEGRWCYQIYFAARAITTIVTITNAAICTQKLLARPPLLVVCRFIGITLSRGFLIRGANATRGKLNGRAALSVLRLPSLSPRIVCSCRCVVQEAKLLSGWLYRSACTAPWPSLLHTYKPMRPDDIDLDQSPSDTFC
jgi:hypothetical protein